MMCICTADKYLNKCVSRAVLLNNVGFSCGIGGILDVGVHVCSQAQEEVEEVVP